jgi:hypothetical protein
MPNFNLIGGLNGLVSKTNLNLQRNAPGILVVSGVVGVVASGVMACRATLKLNDVVKTAKDNVEKAREIEEPKQMKKELTGAYVKAGVKLAELYLPSIGVGALSITAILSSHHLMTKRNTSLAAAYATLDTMFKGYRTRVAERFGEDAERKIRYNIHEEEVEETVIDKNGKEKTVKKTVEVVGADQNGQYARFFMKLHHDDPSLGSSMWQDNPDYRENVLEQTVRWMNDVLVSRGFLFLNDVYDALGFQKSLPGQSVGWVYDKDKPVGDNFIIFKKTPVHYRNKDGSLEPAVLIDFNVQGDILGRALQKGLINT